MTIYSFEGVSPTRGRDVFIADSAAVIGDVVLGDAASIWFGAVVRGDVMPIRIGARTNIQDGSVVHVTSGKFATHIGDDVTVGHLALVHGCTVGSRCLVGMGAVLLDGVEVGDECIIAAGTLVAPGTKVPPRSLVMGRPGKVVRPVREADLAWVRAGTELYVLHARQFASGSLARLGG